MIWNKRTDRYDTGLHKQTGGQMVFGRQKWIWYTSLTCCDLLSWLMVASSWWMKQQARDGQSMEKRKSLAWGTSKMNNAKISFKLKWSMDTSQDALKSYFPMNPMSNRCAHIGTERMFAFFLRTTLWGGLGLVWLAKITHSPFMPKTRTQSPSF